MVASWPLVAMALVVVAAEEEYRFTEFHLSLLYVFFTIFTWLTRYLKISAPGGWSGDYCSVGAGGTIYGTYSITQTSTNISPRLFFGYLDHFGCYSCQQPNNWQCSYPNKLFHEYPLFHSCPVSALITKRHDIEERSSVVHSGTRSPL